MQSILNMITLLQISLQFFLCIKNYFKEEFTYEVDTNRGMPGDKTDKNLL